MGASKSDQFSEHQNKVSNTLKALAHPARIAIVEYLLNQPSCICGDLVSALPLSQPTISQHLKELKSVGLIKGSVEGTSICYCLDPNAFKSIQSYFEGINNSLKNKAIECC
ncbi:MAG: ArsR family transcriptional regulator [Lentimonas sp.]|jgi:ArsR family transcriptional regulator